MRATILPLSAAIVLAAGWYGGPGALAQDGRVVRDLPAVPGVYALSLLTVPAVGDELGLSAAQARGAREAYEKYREADERLPVAPATGRDKEEADRRWRELQTESQRAVAGLLTPAQAQRFREIRLQRAGALALADATLAAELKLTADQRKAVRAIAADREEQAKAVTADSTRTNREVAVKLDELTKAAGAKVLKALTDAQRKQWEEMIGKPFRWPDPSKAKD